MLEQVKQNLREELKKALKNSGVNESDIPEIGFESPKHIKFGDLSTNVALGISKKLKKNPRETAQELLGKLNFDTDKLVENAQAFINTIIKLKPSSAKGQYVKSLFLSSSMGPGLRISKDEIPVR